MTRVVTPSRLHFGLLHVPASPESPGRRFGGCGLMVDAPWVAVRVEPAADWSGEGPNAGRAVGFARRVTDRPHRVVVERCPPEHVGLGVGTALGLAVAKALRPDLSAVELAPLVGRGNRSGVGLHGFDRGGFIVDGGKPADAAVPALAGRYEFPAGWRVVLVVPDRPSPWHGSEEVAAFARARDPVAALRTAGRMSELLVNEIGPALEGGQFGRFSRALAEYNLLAGEPFAADQGGAYAGPAVARAVEAVRASGVEGAGQSSWGPTAWAMVDTPDRATGLAGELRGRLPGAEVVVTAAADAGAVVTTR